MLAGRDFSNFTCCPRRQRRKLAQRRLRRAKVALLGRLIPRNYGLHSTADRCMILGGRDRVRLFLKSKNQPVDHREMIMVLAKPFGPEIGIDAMSETIAADRKIPRRRYSDRSDRGLSKPHGMSCRWRASLMVRAPAGPRSSTSTISKSLNLKPLAILQQTVIVLPITRLFLVPHAPPRAPRLQPHQPKTPHPTSNVTGAIANHPARR